MTKRFLPFLVILIFLGTFIPGKAWELGVSTPTVTPTSTPTATVTLTATATPYPVVIPLIISEPTPVGYGPEEYDYGVNPLTGLRVPDPAQLERRPIAIKVTNYPRYVRPQSGLSKADLVFEYYMERGVPRFIAVYYGQNTDRVGPVRSGRFFDEHVVRMYDAIFVFGSADKRVMDYFGLLDDHFKHSFVIENDDLRHDCNVDENVALCRDTSLVTYNNLFVNTAAMSQYITWRGTDNDKPDLTGMRFGYRTPIGGELALNIYTRFSLFMYNRWAYSVELGRYVRFQETIGKADPNFESYEPHLDATTGEQLAADNVVVLIVDYDYFVKTNTTEIMDVNLIGSGEGFAFRDGYMFPVRWFRPLEGGVLQIQYLDGMPFPLKPGNTWFEVISQESDYYSEGVDWRFIFNLPPMPQFPVNPTAKLVFTPELTPDDLTATPTPEE
jgi:hypothetical protein